MTNDVCECLNWKQLYDAGRLWCGEGLEFYHIANMTAGATKEELMPLITAPNASGFQFYEHHCRDMFYKFDNNRCVNFGPFAWDPNDFTSTDQWCYVPFNCKNLNGGGRLKTKPVSWKRCERGIDKQLRDFPPQSLFNYVASLNVPNTLGTIFRFAYPSLRPEIWFDVKKKWKKKEYSRLPEMLKSAIRKNVPIVIETMPITQSTFANKKVIYNGTLWAIICQDARKASCLQREEDFEHLEL